MQSKIFAIKEIKFAKKDIKSIFALKCSFFSDIIKKYDSEVAEWQLLIRSCGNYFWTKN